ncbi:hypothetical protein [Kitasatospora sp. NPDC086791]|uniref:hypothetical protein n=1 Tax=Kitasatospora sp. NPDC086791 TaxID=3155178 RepID=UPI00341C6090
MDTAEFTRRQIALEITTLHRDADRLAEETRRYAATVGATAAGNPAPGDARRIAELALQVAQQAARVQGIQDTADYTTDRTAGGAR